MNTVRTRKRFDIADYLPYFIGVVSIVLIVALLSLAFRRDVKKINFSKLKAMPFSAESVFEPFAGGAVYIDNSDNCLYYVDDRGEKMWGFSGTTEDMKLYTSESRIAVTVGKKLQVINKEGNLVFSKEFEKTISDVAIGEKIMAVKLSHSDDTTVLNGTGEEIDRIVSNTNCTNIRFGTYSQGSIWVLTVENSGISPIFRLSTYKYENEKTQMVSFTEDNQMIYNAVFNGNLCYIFGTDKIMIRDCDYTGAVNLDYTANGYDVIATGLIKGNVNILMLNNGNLKSVTDKQVRDIPCEEKICFGAISSKGYYCFSNYFMYKFNDKNAKYKKYRFPVRVDNIVQGNGYVLVESENNVYRFSTLQ